MSPSIKIFIFLIAIMWFASIMGACEGGRKQMVGAQIDRFGPHARILKNESIRKEIERSTMVTCNKVIARELKQEAIMAEQEAKNVEEGKDAKDPNRRGMRKNTSYSVQ